VTRGAALSLGIAACLAACTPSDPSRAPAQGLVPDSGGLQPNGTPLRIDFGRAESGVIPAVSRLLGEDPAFRGPLAGCSLTAVRWSAGLTLWFDGGAFVGWTAVDPIGAGSAGRICAGA
jgi:hypothetical protein